MYVCMYVCMPLLLMYNHQNYERKFMKKDNFKAIQHVYYNLQTLFRELLTCGAGTLVRLYTRNYITRKQIHTQARGRNRRPHLILILLLLPRCTYPIARSLDLFAYPLPGLSIRLCGQAQPRFILVKIPIHVCSFLMSFRHSEDLRICVHVGTSGRKNCPKRICPTQNRRENCPGSDCPGVNCPSGELSGG